MGQGTLALSLAAALLLPAPARAVRPLTPPAPAFPEDAAWVNAQPMTMGLFKGRRVVVVAFLNLGNYRSRRAAKVLARWWDRYALEGLMVVGVHTPDYEFDRDPLQVRRTVRDAGVPFPVVIDTRKKLWDGYQNEGWPAFYLVDHKGRVIHDKLGEGGYGNFEREILAALENFNGYRPRADATFEADPKPLACGTATAAVYLGSRRGAKVAPLAAKSNLPLTPVRDGELAMDGRWEEEAESLRFTGRGDGVKDELYLIWRGAEAGAVLSRLSTEPTSVFVKLDNLWLHGGNAGPDVKWDDSDRSYVLVDGGRLYQLAHDPNRDRMHELSLLPGGPRVAAHAFEFSDHCEAQADAK